MTLIFTLIRALHSTAIQWRIACYFVSVAVCVLTVSSWWHYWLVSIFCSSSSILRIDLRFSCPSHFGAQGLVRSTTYPLLLTLFLVAFTLLHCYCLYHTYIVGSKTVTKAASEIYSSLASGVHSVRKWYLFIVNIWFIYLLSTYFSLFLNQSLFQTQDIN